eukprot:CAMPEP_0197594026 /NCGR_PEP_ID=MMETSP1326-20131121/19593_1 /TAXON_ID=1155430 /ORGANISM="Genus nov. species nov., Strain RCC2288" /LENGTH=84 /DNA_ID=CAMNT_0043160123 /DNA_START=12 /DNA_END=262 /DNA_ORIENTATION=+
MVPINRAGVDPTDVPPALIGEDSRKDIDQEAMTALVASAEASRAQWVAVAEVTATTVAQTVALVAEAAAVATKAAVVPEAAEVV